nr:class I SAM-dependent methyltransferase [Paenibacillus pinihumi]
MQLGQIQSDAYDLVYTSNGVHVWINDLNAMYQNISRVLKTGGRYIMFDIHPFMRPLSSNTEQLIAVKPYDATGPFGEPPTYKWRIQDLTNALALSGLTHGGNVCRGRGILGR